jgi:hypothetical protein
LDATKRACFVHARAFARPIYRKITRIGSSANARLRVDFARPHKGFFARDPGYTHIALRKFAPSAGKVLRAIKRLDFVRTHGRPR